MVIVLSNLWKITVNSRPVETHNRKERYTCPSCCPIARTPLWVSINEEYPRPLHGKCCGDMNRKRCLPYPALLVEHGNNHARPLTEKRVSVKTYFCISVADMLSSKKNGLIRKLLFLLIKMYHADEWLRIFGSRPLWRGSTRSTRARTLKKRLERVWLIRPC